MLPPPPPLRFRFPPRGPEGSMASIQRTPVSASPPPPGGSEEEQRRPTSWLVVGERSHLILQKQEVLHRRAAALGDGRRVSQMVTAGLWENPPHLSTHLIAVVTGETSFRHS